MKALRIDDEMRPAEAASLLEQAEHRRERAQADLDAFWFPLVLFGSLSMVAAGLSLAVGLDSLGLFWLVAGPGGGALTARHYIRRGRRLGVGRVGWPYVAVSAALMIGAFLTGGLGTGLVQELGPVSCVACCYLGFAWIERSVAVACVALGMGGVIAALALLQPPATVELALLGTGALMLTSGLFVRYRSEAA